MGPPGTAGTEVRKQNAAIAGLGKIVDTRLRELASVARFNFTQPRLGLFCHLPCRCSGNERFSKDEENLRWLRVAHGHQLLRALRLDAEVAGTDEIYRQKFGRWSQVGLKKTKFQCLINKVTTIFSILQNCGRCQLCAQEADCRPIAP